MEVFIFVNCVQGYQGVCAHTFIYTHLHTHTHTHMHTRVHTYTRTHTNTQTHTHTRIHTHTPTHTRTQTHKRTHTGWNLSSLLASSSAALDHLHPQHLPHDPYFARQHALHMQQPLHLPQQFQESQSSQQPLLTPHLSQQQPQHQQRCPSFMLLPMLLRMESSTD